MSDHVVCATKRAGEILGALLGVALGVCAAPAGEPQAPGRIMPQDLVYRGAFRLPDGPDEFAWAWSGEALAFYPQGAPKGPDDGHGGSLFGAGHNWHHHVSEISIPRPVLSDQKDLKALPTAKTLQKFQSIGGDLFGKIGQMEQARMGLAYLPAMGKQTTGKLYFCRGPHMHEGSGDPSHGWCELDLSNPRPAGPWRIADATTYVTTDYLFPIPQAWADKHAAGRCLATGRFRDGGQGSQGPTLLAIAPWLDGNPPPPGAKLRAVTLLRYSCVTDEQPHRLKGYHHADEWSGGAWLTAGQRSAVVFLGTKGQGKCWYGFANGVVWPDEPPFPPIPPAPNDSRGWWSTSFVGQVLFYDPADLAAVAAGSKKPWEPQPYAAIEIDKHLFAVKGKQRKSHVGAAAFDSRRGFLYVLEPRADEDKSIIHVWDVRPRP